MKGEMVSEEWLDPGVRQAKLEQHIGIPPTTIFSDGSDNESVRSNITDRSEEFSIDESSQFFTIYLRAIKNKRAIIIIILESKYVLLLYHFRCNLIN